jgi:hypothetical protein
MGEVLDFVDMDDIGFVALVARSIRDPGDSDLGAARQGEPLLTLVDFDLGDFPRLVASPRGAGHVLHPATVPLLVLSLNARS